MIIWLASYPKSGNTWLRLFLCSYLFLDSKTKSFSLDLIKNIPSFPNKKLFAAHGIKPKNFEDVAKSWLIIQKKINSNNKVNFLKTHHSYVTLNQYSFTNKENTIGAIHLVRDPRDVLISYSKHMNKTVDETLKLITANNHVGYLDDTNITGDIRGSWSLHYNTWKNFNLKEKIIIRYEDLINKPYENFHKIILYLNKLIKIKIDEKKIKRCIELTNFENLKKIENLNGFVEGNNKNVPFLILENMNNGKTVLIKKL
ncbi:MAG: hypothetical protein CMJ04_02675 [Pelagibacteraceae bacterium]|nr:hypothetical protein [Pelagibacteraceae bacterium]